MNNDKKKLIIVATLAVVVLGVGAFQFTQMSGGEAKPQATAKREVKQEPEATGTENTISDAMKDLIKVGMGGPRDPFVPGMLEQLPDMNPQPPQQKTPTPVPSNRRPTFRPPSDFQGENPPWNPLPNAGNGGSGAPAGGNTNLTPIPDPNAFRYTVTGIITGSKPAAVFTDPNGNQRLVPLGGSPGEGSQLVGVDRGRVVVKHNGKTLTFNVGGTPNVK
jgi:hypothetical protein